MTAIEVVTHLLGADQLARLRARMESGHSNEMLSDSFEVGITLIRRLRLIWDVPTVYTVRQRRWGGDLPRPHFPGAQLRRFAEATAACDRCGGPWRRDRDALDCVLCGRRLHVAEGLAALRTAGLA